MGATLVLGAAVVALPWLAVKYVPVAAALALVGCWGLVRAGQGRRALVLAGSLAVAGVAFLVLHRWWYGGWTPYAAGDHFVGGELSVVGTEPDYLGRSRRLLGLLVDRGFGLAAWQPAWLLAVPALAAMLARRPRGWAAVAAPLAAGWLVATFVALTMHGWWFAGRQVVVVLPLAALAVAWWTGPDHRRRVLLAVAARGRGAGPAVAGRRGRRRAGHLGGGRHRHRQPAVPGLAAGAARLPGHELVDLGPARGLAGRPGRLGGRRRPASTAPAPLP